MAESSVRCMLHSVDRHDHITSTSALAVNDTTLVGHVDFCCKEQSSEQMPWQDFLAPVLDVALSLANTHIGDHYSNGDHKRSLPPRRAWKPIVPRCSDIRIRPTAQPSSNFNSYKAATHRSSGSVNSNEAKPPYADTPATRPEPLQVDSSVNRRDGFQSPDIPYKIYPQCRRRRKKHRGSRLKKNHKYTRLRKKLLKECNFLFESWEKTRDEWLQSSDNKYFGSCVRHIKSLQMVDSYEAYGDLAEDTGMFFRHKLY